MCNIHCCENIKWNEPLGISLGYSYPCYSDWGGTQFSYRIQKCLAKHYLMIKLRIRSAGHVACRGESEYKKERGH
jgi:hypothetical protein